jgi:hypothetical protein
LAAVATIVLNEVIFLANNLVRIEFIFTVSETVTFPSSVIGVISDAVLLCRRAHGALWMSVFLS